MEKTLSIVFLSIFVLFVFFIMRGVFLKGILHFRLLKKIYPEKLKDITSYFQLMWLTRAYKLNFDMLIWFWMPIYYSKVLEKKFDKEAFELHLKLKRNNKKLAIIFLCFVIFFISFWIIANKIGE